MQDRRRNKQDSSSDRMATVRPPANRLAAVREASQALLRFHTPEDLSASIIRILEKLLAYDHLAVMRVDAGRKRLVPFAVSDQGMGPVFRQEDMDYIESAGIRVGDGVVGWVAQYGTSALIGDVREDPRYLALRENIGSELCVPMIVDGEVIGVINAETERTGAFDIGDQFVLETVAAQIAIAMENVSLLTEAEATRRDVLVAKYAGSIAHDLGNLLAAISLDAAILTDKPDIPGECREQLGRIITASQQGVSLAHSMLHAGREAPADEVQEQACDLNGVVRANELLIRALAGSEHRVDIRIADEHLSVGVSAADLEQVILNLVLNARQAMDESGEIIIETLLDAGSVPGTSLAVLQVTDTGAGMSDQVREQAFKPYFTTRDEGSGLGLATVWQVLESAGGSAAIDSAPGAGTRVRASFPLLREALSA